MRALVVHGARDLRVENVSDPVPRNRHGAVVRVTDAGICGSDLHLYHGDTLLETGFCIGHEAIGEVVETGSAVTRWKPGDRVLLPAAVGCGRCTPCRSGDVTGCAQGLASCYGLTNRLPGSQAEAVAVPSADTNLVAIPEGVGNDDALLVTDCASTAWYGARKARVGPGDSVAVVGLGPIGLVAVMAAQVMGAAQVFGIDPVPDRRRRAETLGATAFDVDEAVDGVMSRTGRGADAVIEAVGRDDSIGQALRLVRPRGAVSVIGVSWSRHFDFPMARVQAASIDFHIGLADPGHEIPVLLRLLAAGRMAPSSVISHRLGLERGPDAYEMLDAKAGDVCKIVLQPGS